MGASAWVDDAYETVYTRATIANWTSDDVTDWGNATLTHDEAHGLYFNGKTDNGSFSATKSFTIDENSKIKYELSWVVGGATSGTSNYLYVQLGDKLRFGYNSNYKVYLSQDGGTTYGEKEYSGKNSNVATHNIEVIFDTSTGAVEKLTYDATDITNDVAGVLTGNFNSVTFGFVKSGTRTTYGKTSGLDKLIVSEHKQTVSTANYTVNFKDENNNVIKDAVQRTGVIGTTVTALESDKAEFYVGEQLYTYVSATSTEVTSDGSAEFTVTYHKAVKYSYTITSNVGDLSFTGSIWEGKSVSVPYPLYINVNGTLYKKDANKSDYHQSIAITSDGQASVLEYAATNITNVVYHSEAEYIAGATATSAGSNMNGRSSNAQCGYATEDLVLISLPAGSYKATLVCYSNSSAGATQTFMFGATEFAASVEGSSNWTTFEKEFTLSSTSDIKWLANDGNKNGLDFIYIQKTSETVNFTLGADDGDSYKSYVTSAATDFAATGVTAYIAKAADTTNGTVTLSTIDQAPANTPVLLKGTKGGTAEIATTSDEVAAISTNYLKAANATEISSTDAKYVLAYNSGWEFRHYNGTLSAGKVYLDLSSLGVEAARLSFIFDDKTTGINTVNGEGVTANGFYNLSGQRVAQPTKGLYIVNGKKIIIK